MNSLELKIKNRKLRFLIDIHCNVAIHQYWRSTVCSFRLSSSSSSRRMCKLIYFWCFQLFTFRNTKYRSIRKCRPRNMWKITKRSAFRLSHARAFHYWIASEFKWHASCTIHNFISISFAYWINHTSTGNGEAFHWPPNTHPLLSRPAARSIFVIILWTGESATKNMKRNYCH